MELAYTSTSVSGIGWTLLIGETWSLYTEGQTLHINRNNMDHLDGSSGFGLMSMDHKFHFFSVYVHTARSKQKLAIIRVADSSKNIYITLERKEYEKLREFIKGFFLPNKSWLTFQM